MKGRGENDTVDRRSGLRISLLTALSLLLAGGFVGYFLGLPGSEIQSSAAATTAPPGALPDAAPTQQAFARYEWLEQTKTSPVQQAWGLFAAVDLDGSLYLLVFANVDPPGDRVLWRSEDGTNWTEIPLDLGDEFVVHDLDVIDDRLLLSGWHSGEPSLWSSQPLPGTEPEWELMRLPGGVPRLGEIRAADSDVATEVNDAGEVTVAVTAHVEITELLLSYVDDPTVESLFHLDELPEVAAAGQRLWVRVTEGGEESLHVVDLPNTTRLDEEAGRYGTEVGPIVSRSLWTSGDGLAFNAVDVSNVPAVPSPLAFGDIFVSTMAKPGDTLEVWASADGDSWSPGPPPPSECGDWDSLAVAAPGLLLTNAAFDLMCVSATGIDWIVHESPQTAISTTGQVWLQGGDAGFLALAHNSREFAVLISADGFDWQPVQFAAGVLGTHTLQVGDTLVTSVMMIEPEPAGREFNIWVGLPEDS